MLCKEVFPMIDDTFRARFRSIPLAIYDLNIKPDDYQTPVSGNRLD